jgi:hypothetical protein
MGSSASSPSAPVRPPVSRGRVRLCVAGFKWSHNTGLAQKTAVAIAKAHPDAYETWFLFQTPGNFRSFLSEHVKPQLPEEQRTTFEAHRTSPFCWLEMDDGTMDAKGGGDRFREWALETFPDVRPVVVVCFCLRFAFCWLFSVQSWSREDCFLCILGLYNSSLSLSFARVFFCGDLRC